MIDDQSLLKGYRPGKILTRDPRENHHWMHPKVSNFGRIVCRTLSVGNYSFLGSILFTEPRFLIKNYVTRRT